MKNSALPQKQQWQLLTDTIASQKNAYSIRSVVWNGFTSPPKDSFQGKCGTPACIAGWVNFLELSIHIPNPNQDYCFGTKVIMPNPSNSNAKFNFKINPEWFTRKKTILMLKHFVATSKWNEDDWMIRKGDVDWLIDEKEIV